MKKNKIYFLIILLLIVSSLIYPKKLYEIININHWDNLKPMFYDGTYLILKNYFKEAKKIHLVKIRENKIKYFVKYTDKAEIGFIKYKTIKKKYGNLKIQSNFSNMQFITGFNRYYVKNKTLKIGDAELKFKKGFLYQARPNRKVFFFKGKFTLNICPNDIEEQRTLNYIYKSDKFFISKKKCLLVLTSSLVKKILDVDVLAGKKKISYFAGAVFMPKLFKFYKNKYGVKNIYFNEYWYLPVDDASNIIVFNKKRLFLKYVYNRNASPDTYLLNINDKTHILNYNHNKEMKFSFGPSNKTKKIQLNIRLNPHKLNVWSTALLMFDQPSDLKCFEVFENMQIHDFFIENELDYIRYADRLYITGKDYKEASFLYSGKLSYSRDNMGKKIGHSNIYNQMTDNFIFFDNENKFYPNPGNQFFESTLRVSVPKPFNCIASGFLKSKKTFNNRNEKIFKTMGTKGLTIVCGKFTLKDKLKTKIPLKIFASDDVRLKQYFDRNEIISIFDYLYKIYGRRGIKNVSLLLRRWNRYGGVSYKGFVVLDIIKRQFLKLEVSKKINLISSPVVLTANIRRDNLVHELAHQWWGGIISWKTYKDVWITEGGAQFSALLYLEKILSKKKFNRIIKKVIKKVRPASKSGPIIYGKRITNITEKMVTYQSLIYNKAALVFFMFRDMVGKDVLFKKIDNIFTKFKAKSMSTSKFIYEMIRDESDEKKMYLERFFKKWIYLRDTPVVYYKLSVKKNEALLTFEQQDTDFVFPLRIIINTKDGQEFKKIIIRNKKQDVKIISESIIKNIKVDKCFSPIYLKEKRRKR